MPVLSIILGDQFGQDLAAPVESIRLVNAGRRNARDLVDTEEGGASKTSKVPRTFRSKKS
jgi:hypothetical protein